MSSVYERAQAPQLSVAPSLGRRLPQSQTQPMRLAGLPTTRARGGTLREATPPAPTMQYSPRVIPATITAIRPKRSTLTSRSVVDISREFLFRHAKVHYHGIPIIAANMDTTGTFEMARALEAAGAIKPGWKAGDYFTNDLVG